MSRQADSVMRFHCLSSRCGDEWGLVYPALFVHEYRTIRAYPVDTFTYYM